MKSFLLAILHAFAAFALTPAGAATVIYIDSYRFGGPASPPPGGDPYFSNVVLLLHADGTDASTTFTDSSSSAKTVTANGNAQIDTAEKKFGTASGLFDGSGDYLITSSASADFSFGTSTDFTVEAWVYVMNIGSSGTASNFLTTTSRTYYFGLFNGSIVIGNNVVNVFVNTISFAAYLDKWTHVAHTRSGTTHRVFLDGVLVGTTTSSASFGAADTINVGRDPFYGALFNGWVDEVRVTKGVCRYTATFTAPTEAFPDS